jgi:tRNA modification GTPase
VDFVLLVLAGDEVYDDVPMVEAAAGQRRLHVVNKTDLLDAGRQEVVGRQVAARYGGPVRMVSAATGAGCEELREAVGARASDVETSGYGRIVLTARHSEALRAGLEAIRAAGGGEAAELVALHLREAAGQLGQITGQVTTEDLLERVFSRFCIGK